MKLRWGLYLAILAAPVTGAATIDLSSKTSAVVHTGDTLVFHLLTSNFGVHAAAAGLPLDPTDVNFALATAPLSVAPGFSATLESADRSVAIAFGNLTFSTGYFQGSGYAGEVATLQGYLHLSPQLSEELLSGPSAVLALRNEGPDVTVGLAPYVLRQSMAASLSGGGLSVGAIPGLVDLESRVIQGRLMNLETAPAPTAGSEVPEPESGGLFLVGGVVLFGLSVILARIARRSG